MIFYHISTNLQHIGVFKPRIPEYRHQEAEDDITPRISVCETISECFTAIPNGGSRLEDLNMENRCCYLVFIIDTEKLSIPSECIITPQELYQKDLVRDANITNEHWITCPFTISESDSYIINVTQWDEESEDIVPYELLKVIDEEYDGDISEAYWDKYEDYLPCSTKIVDVISSNENLKFGEKARIYFNCEDEERDSLINYLNNNFSMNEDIEIVDEYIDEFYILSKKENINLKDFYIYHHQLIGL